MRARYSLINSVVWFSAVIWTLFLWVISHYLRPVAEGEDLTFVKYLLLGVALVEGSVAYGISNFYFTPSRLGRIWRRSGEEEKYAWQIALGANGVVWALIASIPLYALIGHLLGVLGGGVHFFPAFALFLLFFTRRTGDNFTDFVNEILKENREGP